MVNIVHAAPPGARNGAPATGFVTSRDGTMIGYREFGRGPGVVLLHGAMSTGHHHLQVAQALADAFTVYLPDRRGRGLSASGDVDVQREVEDLQALLTNTDARSVFGCSSGAIIALQAALALPSIQKAVIWEPPFFADGALPVALMRRYEDEIARGKVAAALVTAMLAAQLGPPVFRAVPRWLIERLTGMMLAFEAKQGAGDYVPMSALAPTLRSDFRIVEEMHNTLERFRALHADVLLLGGSKSPAFVKDALDALERVLPHAERVELPGLDQAAPWNADRGGRPDVIAHELRLFFS